jgi:hypothetical protein
VALLYLTFHKRACIPSLPQNVSVCLFKYIILCSVLYLCVGKVTRGEGENTGVNKRKEPFIVMVNLFPQELRDTYLSTVLEQVTVQV